MNKRSNEWMHSPSCHRKSESSKSQKLLCVRLLEVINTTQEICIIKKHKSVRRPFRSERCTASSTVLDSYNVGRGDWVKVWEKGGVSSAESGEGGFRSAQRVREYTPFSVSAVRSINQFHRILFGHPTPFCFLRVVNGYQIGGVEGDAGLNLFCAPS